MSGMTIEKAVSQLVDEILSQAEASAVQAVKEAFSKTRKNAPPGREKVRRGAKRSRAEDYKLAEALCQRILANPGCLMKELAKELEVAPRDLRGPAKKLLAAGRAKTTGARNATRYYPLGNQADWNKEGGVVPSSLAS
jgi:hypothetical protein